MTVIKSIKCYSLLSIVSDNSFSKIAKEKTYENNVVAEMNFILLQWTSQNLVSFC